MACGQSYPVEPMRATAFPSERDSRAAQANTCFHAIPERG